MKTRHKKAKLLVGLFILISTSALGWILFHFGHLNNNKFSIGALFFNGRVALVPMGEISNPEVSLVKAKIKEFYGFEVDLLKKRPMPQNAYFKPRNRYKAKPVLDFLNAIKPGKYDKIIALTTTDISTNIPGFTDWGIMGLAYLGQSACIVSTYRLGKNQVNDAKYQDRLAKVALHEVGHTLALRHCEKSELCFMRDARGKVKTIDRVKFILCENCKEQIAYLAQ